MKIVPSYCNSNCIAPAARRRLLPANAMGRLRVRQLTLAFGLVFCATAFTSRLAAAQNAGTADKTNTDSVPVLLELFTSEGCSSCPPADRLLEKVDRQQPVQGADLIVISEHVDYWNNLGWTDPYSSKFFSQRQQEYAERLDADVYTPQLVIDGAHAGVGGDWNNAQEAIHEAIGKAKLPVTVNAQRNGSNAAIHIEISGSSQASGRNVFLVLASNHVNTNVERGENAGRELGHTAVAYSVQKIGALPNGSPFEKDLQLPVRQSSRVIVFVQDSRTGHILGVAQART